MAENRGLKGILFDGIEALKLVARLSWKRNVTAWLYVPVGVLVILLACFGFDSLIGLSSVSFPASVALLVVLFFGLMICDWILGDRKTRALVNVIDIPAGWALRYINIFFTPSFVLLPLSPPIGGAEVGKIIAVFLIGFVVMVAVTAWLVRGLQLLMGSSKRAITERAEEMGNESDAIPLANAVSSRHESEVNLPSGTTNPALTGGTFTPPGLVEDMANDLIAPQRTQDPSLIRGTGGPPDHDASLNTARNSPPLQAPLPLTRPQRWAAFINLNFDRITYTIIFLFVGLPIYYTTGYAMPAQLAFNVLAYFAALALPPRWKQFLHPVLVSSAITILGVWILGLIRGENLTQILTSYKTGTTYLDLWHGETSLPLPGAGDIFGSVLDASIVALALPMFSYRQELKRHFFAIVIPNVTISVGSLFGYPALCYAIGISSTRSLAFAGRSLTLALATPATKNLGGDVNTNAALAIMSGILGVLIGPRILEWLRIPEDDYVTRGVTLGGNSSAIATALLLVSDPRAAALSSLSMTLFGIITLALTSVPPIVQAIKSLVDL
ncbi:Plastidal glycolate/glycerate translocator 1-like chloroplastic protein [Lachnellula suecica]|uniref:Plastidal glycolate/glycerate translocator 1-like chloroplastic protein n=1 Tax=Lachnellula suecica TaxID=602035 RepID=A0A8T9C4W3_9HELO|nr:Plastidal glycolate/glycerate translocator 1-like chloroplastic protein [Lachnellula suecica]